VYFGTGFFCGPSDDVEDLNLRLGLRGHLGNALAHGTRTHHAYLLKTCIHSDRLWPTKVLIGL
jgi:hypothetical protein